MGEADGVVGVGVAVPAEAVGEGWGVAVGLGLVVGLGVLVGVIVTDIGTCVGVGVTKIILIALSSGTGDRIFLPDTNTPTVTATRTKNPTIKVMAASVRRLSSIHPQSSTQDQLNQII